MCRTSILATTTTTLYVIAVVIVVNLINLPKVSAARKKSPDPRWVNGVWTWPPNMGMSSPENMFPDGSRPWKNITCKGSLPPWPLPIFPDWNPNNRDTTTLQDICAMPQFLGKAPGRYGPRSIPGYCGTPVAEESWDRYRPYIKPDDDWEIIRKKRPRYYITNSDTYAYPGLEPEPGPHHQQSLYHPRLIYYCSQRCYCTQDHNAQYAVWWRHRQQVPEAVLNEQMPYSTDIKTITLQPRRETFVMRVEKQPNFYHPVIPHIEIYKLNNQQLQGDEVLAAELVGLHNGLAEMSDKTGIEKSSIAPSVSHISLDPKNEIECDNNQPLPDFPLPPPATWENFTSIQSLCALSLSGGFPPANAGGFCRVYKRRSSFGHRFFRRPLPLLPIERTYDVWFSDELTPRPEWTWHDNFQFAGRVRRFCWQRCWCKNKPRPPPDKRPNDLRVWSLMDNEDIVRMAGHVINLLGGGSANGGQPASVRIAPPDSKDYGPQAAQCVVDGTDYCSQKPWPTDVLGPVPTVDMLPPLNDDNQQQCTLPCTGPSSCNTQQQQSPESSNCPPMTGICAVDPRSAMTAAAIGKEPSSFSSSQTGSATAALFYAVASCVLAKQQQKPGLMDSSSSSLSGRRDLGQGGLVEGKDKLVSQEEEWPCACNASYVSHACCTTISGMVWEQQKRTGTHLLGQLLQ